MLTGLLARNAAAWASKAAVVQGERRISQKELNDETGRLANRLSSLGVRRGDEVAIMLSNSPEFIIAFFATMRLHAVTMPLNPNYTAGEIGRFLSEKPVRALITDASRAALFGQSVEIGRASCRERVCVPV